MTLAPRLQQSVKLLQMSALEFTNAVEHALATNPFLEDGDEQDSETADNGPDTRPVGHGEHADAPAEHTTTPSAENEEAPPDAPAYSGDYPMPSSGTGEGKDLGQWASASLSMRERLSQDLGNYHLEPRDRLLAEFIIDALDDDGYLRVPLGSLCSADRPEFSPPPDEGEWTAALRLRGLSTGQPAIWRCGSCASTWTAWARTTASDCAACWNVPTRRCARRAR
ncbi:hypothetical protein G6F31_016980 [Rhizopus arrhizus]|nr:hypothetical protein G6F31_016980 [Rhizopus arrhizus]